MKILVVGSGGREHALVWKLLQEAEVFCAPGNAGIAQIAECVDIPATDISSLVILALGRQVDLVVVGPEDPLVLGLADALRSQGIPVFGPSEAASRLEASKAFSKELMIRAGVPTAQHRSFTDADLAKEYAKQRYSEGIALAVKASGNALGKGVVVANSVEEALDAIDELRSLGDAGSTLVLEDKLVGKEFSLLTLVSGQEIYSLPVARDRKPIFDNDLGPNTGGMGTFAPVGSIDASLVKETEEKVVLPILRALAEEGTEYRGCLFSGLMFDGADIKCLEYNVRFGDPETQSVMPLLKTGFAEALLACALGKPIPPVGREDATSVTVVVASGGYPGTVKKGVPIEIGAIREGVRIFHAGTKMVDGELVTNGGRVFGVNATGVDVDAARAMAYEAVSSISFDGMQFRADIGLDSLA